MPCSGNHHDDRARGFVIVEAIVRVMLAFVLVLPLAWERERHSGSAGLRTHAIVSMAVCGFLLIERTRGRSAITQADIFFGMLNGIGFVGSGAIVKSPERSRGMRTAVSLWVAGAIGAGVAFGSSFVAATLALMSALASWIPSPRDAGRSA